MIFQSNSDMEQDIEKRSTLVLRTLDTLETLSRSDAGMALADVANSTSTPKPAMHRILQSLRSRGYVDQDGASGRYSAGIRCFELGSTWAHNLDTRTVAAPHLKELNDETMETVHLAVYEHGDVVYIDKYESPQQVIAKSYIGRRCPATCVATGRVLLAYSPKSEIERVLDQPLPSYTENSITDPIELRGVLNRIRVDGFGENHGAYRKHVGGLSAPIRDHTGQVVAAVGLCLPEYRLGPGRVEFLRDWTIQTALNISSALGAPMSC